ncbi:acyltransferase family protein [Leptospira wolffii]|uniref:Acyltransferase family protein n=1 Tax=Leptospira wolffii TaxID=409998 RepID=A0ABV5BJ12_9LEPT|nr:acyltransferase [Leptospira wolffii]TGL49029.1 acyltransferase [Leptospira wolffii]
MKDYFLGIFRSDEREIGSFNGVRTLGFFMLIYGHMFRTVQLLLPDINPYLRNFLDNGSACLDLFFPLSGFLIASPLLAELDSKGTINWKFFYVKRFLRIFPPFYFFLMLQYFVFFPILIKSAPQETAAQLIGSKYTIWFDVFYISNYFKGTMFHGWSLSLEEQFYVLLPIFLLLIFRYVPKKLQLAFLTVLALLPLVYRAIFMQTVMLQAPASEHVYLYNKNFYYPFHGHIDSVLYGIILAYIFNFRRHWLDRILKLGNGASVLHFFVWVALILFSLLVYEFEVGWWQVFRFPIYSLLWITILILSIRQGDPIGKFLSWKGFSPFAKLSYCAYIIHIVVMVPVSRKLLFMDKKLEQHEILLYTIPVGLVVFFFAYFYHLLTERPFVYLKDRIIRKYKAKVTSEIFREKLETTS